MTEPQSRAARRKEQRRQRRRRRVRLTAVMLSVLGLLAIAFAVALAKDAPDTSAPAPEPTAESRTQRTLMLQVQGPDNAGVTAAVLAHDAEAGRGSAVLVPPQVLVSVPTAGSVPLGQAVLQAAPERVRNALSDLMGVTLDDHWFLGQQAFTTLVDEVGGIEADVDVAVLRSQAVVLDPGPQRLDGAQAYAFLTYLAAGEQEQVRLARVQEVLDGLIGALTSEAGDLAATLASLGDRSVSSLSAPGLADWLLAMEAADEKGRLQYDVLPVIDLDVGEGVVAFRLDAEGNRALVDRLLRSSVTAGAREGGNRVLVFNGVGTPGLGEQVRTRLVPAGFVLVDARNAPSFGVAKTQILVPAVTTESQALAARVAAALGLPDAVVATRDLGTTADVAVLLGADFRP